MKLLNMKYFIFAVVFVMVISMAGCTYLPFQTTNTTTTHSTVITTTSPTLPAAVITTTTTSEIPQSGWTPPVTTGERPVLPDFVSVIARVQPSVVAINTTSTGYDIFNQPYTQDGAGTGWVLDTNGLIATNNHVIDGADTINVTFADGTTLPATVVGADTVADLAVLKVNKTGLPAAQIGDSSGMRLGDLVVALGNALGEGISATDGIVSRIGVSISTDSGQTLTDLIQTTAPINAGNSGGPLVDMKGEVIGITSAKLAAVGVEGMGYAIGTKTALPIFQSLITQGYVVRPYLGVRMEDDNQLLALRYNLGTNKGAFLDEIVAGSPAAGAGLKAADVIIKLNGVTVNTAADAQAAIRAAQIGQAVTIVFYRGKNLMTIQAILEKAPSS